MPKFDRTAITKGMRLYGAEIPVTQVGRPAPVMRGDFLFAGGGKLRAKHDPRLELVRKSTEIFTSTARQLDVANQRLQALTAKIRDARNK